MKKEFEYKGHKFSVSVELNHQVEKRIGGKRVHRVVINCMDYDNYYKVSMINEDLKSGILELEQDARDYIDAKIDKAKNLTDDEKVLAGLGFKK